LSCFCYCRPDTTMDIPQNSSCINIPGRDVNYDLSTTPGGSIYGTTPGGTKIKYSRDALLFIRNSPLSKTPPSNLPVIPGITQGAFSNSNSPNSHQIPSLMPKIVKSPRVAPVNEPDELFSMDD